MKYKPLEYGSGYNDGFNTAINQICDIIENTDNIDELKKKVLLMQNANGER